MVQFLKKPDVIVYLQASTDTLISRIKNRNREFEKNIDVEYLYRLNNYYNAWAKNEKELKILTINTDQFNIFKDRDKLNNIFSLIEKEIDD